MKVNFAQGEPDDVVQLIRASVSSWRPGRGPDWQGLLRQADGEFSRWVLYPVSGAALTTILVLAFLVMVALHVGPANSSVQAHIP
jgi:hypothetical protein